MNEFEESDHDVQLSRVAEQIRKETENWLSDAIRAEVNARDEYVRLVSAMKCNCKNCHGACCNSLRKNCNAA